MGEVAPLKSFLHTIPVVSSWRLWQRFRCGGALKMIAGLSRLNYVRVYRGLHPFMQAMPPPVVQDGHHQNRQQQDDNDEQFKLQQSAVQGIGHSARDGGL